MWIPRRLYELVPFAYMVAGAAALAAAFLLENGPHNLLLVFGLIALTAGLVLWLRRRDYRQDQTEYDSSSLDD